MTSEGRALLSNAGLTDAKIHVACSVDMRYVGQGHEITVPLPPDTSDAYARKGALSAAFETAYLKLYGRHGPLVPQEIMNWRVVVTGPKTEIRLAVEDPGLERANPIKSLRRAYFPELGGFTEIPVYDRYAMPRGFRFHGMAIVEERESTTVVGPDADSYIDEQWNLIVELRGEDL